LYQKKTAALKRERKFERTKKESLPATVAKTETETSKLGISPAKKKISKPKRTVMPSAKKRFPSQREL